MSLPHILLGLLTEPASGYDLRREFETGLAHFWSANLSQVYPTLNQMERDGWVTSTMTPSAHGPPRRVYTRTSAGERALADWLGGPQILSVRRHYLAQVYFLGSLPDAAGALAFFEQFLEILLDRQVALETIQIAWRGEREESFADALPDGEFYPYMALELGLAANRTRIDWCRACIERIRRRGT